MAEATAAAIAPETDIDAVESVKEQLHKMQTVSCPLGLMYQHHDSKCALR